MRPADPAQGWKIHISATILSAPEIFARAYPILRKHDALFKVPAELELLRALNSGVPDFSQIGKSITVYPRSTSEAVDIARQLHRATRGLTGPNIPFDAQYRKNSVVYYRYGVFGDVAGNSYELIRGPNGRPYRDARRPGKAVPTWLSDPFNGRRPKTRKSVGSIGVDYLVFRAKSQRGKGGVYEAVDLSILPARIVIIKVGRRHGETAWDGRDGYARVQHEGRVLRALRGAGIPVPGVFREFTQNGNRYLVLEKVAGRPLIPRHRVQPSTVSWRRAEKVLDQLGALLSMLHNAGWVWRDCKPDHIFLRKGEMRLIDFEGACRIAETKVLQWGSLNYVPPVCGNGFSRRPGVLEDDYALGVIAFQTGTGEFPSTNSHRRARIYKRMICPDHIRLKIEHLLLSHRFD